MIIKILYAAASIQGVFLALLLFWNKLNQPANRILGVFLLIISFHLILVGFDEKEFFMRFPHLSRISWIIGSLYWPLLFLFVQYITRTQPSKIWKSFWIFIPFVILLIAMMPYYSMTAEQKRNILQNFDKASLADFGFVNQLVSILHIIFFSYFLIYYLRLEKKLFDEFSEIDSVRIKWLKQFLIWILCITILAVGAFFARSWNVPFLSQFYSFHFIGIVILFYWLSYQAMTRPVLFAMGHLPVTHYNDVKPVHPIEDEIREIESVAVKEESPKYRKSSLTDSQRGEIFDKVIDLIQNQKLYLKGDLTLSYLSTLLAIPKHQLSESINKSYSGNFFDLINDYRVEEFKRLSGEEGLKHLSLLGIAQEAGFNSKATFYALFKKKTGMTPTEFLATTRKAG